MPLLLLLLPLLDRLLASLFPFRLALGLLGLALGIAFRLPLRLPFGLALGLLGLPLSFTLGLPL
ncbi:MAG: hypothetical protein WBQ93_13300, partial [Candidatus Competibacter sp.]